MHVAVRCSRILLVLLAGGVQLLHAQVPNIRINSPYNTDPEEVSIAINPTNTLNVTAGANLRYSYTSTNGGLTWRQAYMSSTYGVWGDPCLLFDRSGVLYYAHLSNPPSGTGYWIDRIVVQTSTDGGFSWSSGAGIGYSPPIRQQDKEWLGTDMTNSPYSGNVYVAWTEFDSYGSTKSTDSSRIHFSRSTDHGQTWSAPLRVSDLAGNCLDSDSTDEGAVPAVGPNGEVYLSWSGPAGIMFDKSTDGGVTFGTDISVTSQPGGWDFGIPGIYRANGMPVTACDASMSPYRGSIYINWADQRNGTDNTDIFFTRSTDGGSTWTSPFRVNSDTGAHQQFFSWMTVDQASGYIYIIYYDRRHTVGAATDVYLSRSTDGGSTFADEVISESSFLPDSTIFFGDYTNITSYRGHVYPVWMRLDNTVLSVWTAPINDQQQETMTVHGGWNMIALPVDPDDKSAATLLPGAQSHLFGYDGSYTIGDSLSPGQGYWIKYSSDEILPMTGVVAASETVQVTAGWNLIGGLSRPSAVANISSVPGGMQTSAFFAYDGSTYSPVDTLSPGQAAWVRAASRGTLFIPSFAPRTATGKVHIVQGSERPPAPPDPDQIASRPYAFHLEQNYPNPFNPSTTIRFSIPREGPVSLRVYNVYGQEVRRLMEGTKHAGLQTVVFHAGDLPSGVYFYRLTTNTLSATRKMVIIK